MALAGPEVAYDTTPPEVLDVVGNSAGTSTEKVKSSAFLNHWSSRQMVLILCVVSAAITVIIAVSIRFGSASKKSTTSSMPGTVTQTILEVKASGRLDSITRLDPTDLDS